MVRVDSAAILDPRSSMMNHSRNIFTSANAAIFNASKAGEVYTNASRFASRPPCGMRENAGKYVNSKRRIEVCWVYWTLGETPSGTRQRHSCFPIIWCLQILTLDTPHCHPTEKSGLVLMSHENSVAVLA